MSSDNGQVPADQLEVVDVFGQRLRHATANSWHRMQAAAKAAGVSIWITKLNPASYPGIPDDGAIGGYRDLAVQKWLYQHPIGPVHIALPGSSTHGEGTDADISTNDGNRWLGNHAHEFGWTQLFGSEAWHYLHDGVTATAALNSTPLLTQKKKDIDMPRTIQVTSDSTAAPKYHGDYYLIQPNNYVLRKIGNPTAESALFDDTPDVEAISDVRLINLGADLLVPQIVFDALKADNRANAYLLAGDWIGKTTAADLKPLVKVSAGI